MPVVRRTISASATWLMKKAVDMATALSKRAGTAVADRKIIDGYLIIAKKTQGIPDRQGLSASQQPTQVRNSIKLSALVLDLPAYLCLLGRYLINGQASHSRYYLQTLERGRDSYLPGTLVGVQDEQADPLLTAGAFAEIGLGVSGGSYVATRYWGLAQPFNGVGGLHAYSAVATSAARWPMAYAGADDPFVWRLVVAAPTTVRFANGTPAPENPSSPVAGWTLNIGEAVLAAVGAKAITRLLDSPSADYEMNWEGAQYPWMATGRPQPFTSDDGEYGFRITVAANVVYEAAGPYYWYDSPDPVDDPSGGGGSWSEGDNGSTVNGGVPSGAKGLWAADIEVVGTTARVVNSYRVFGGSDDREPLLRDRTSYSGVLGKWYLNNLTYRAPMSTIENEDGTRISIMLSSTFVERTPDGFNPGNTTDPYTAKQFTGKLFLDATWFADSAVRRQNLIETELKRGVYHPGRAEMPYNGANAAFDIADADEGRFTIGCDTNGVEVVFPVFSSFQPGEAPRLRIYLATEGGIQLRYDDVPGFAMCVACGAGEQMIYNYGTVDFPDTPALPNYGEWITLPAPYDHVTYIGNNRYAFYVSSELSDRPADNFFWAPGGNVAVATYSSLTDEVRIAGVIDPEVVSNGFGAESPYTAQQAWFYVSETSAYTVPVFANPPKLGRIEVVRPESEGYDPEDPLAGGHPATLIASKGYGQPGLNLADFDGQDIKQGITWISYDSGATWTQILSYGSPAGTIHCGNIAQARTEPVVRV